MGQSYLVAACRQIRTLIRRGSWVLLCICVSGCATYNTATGRSEMIFISTSSEVSMGNKINHELMSKNKICINTPSSKRLERIGSRLARVSDRQDIAYHFYLIESPEINAFAVPGGHIYCYTGLFDRLTTDDQIAAVLGHEIGHLAAKHTVKKFQAALGYDVMRNVLLEVLSYKAPGIGNIASMGSDGLMHLAMSGYGRQDEYEADRLGIKYLYLSGYDLNAMIELFHVLDPTDKNKVPLIFRTHPFVKDRIARVSNVIKDVRSKY